jgi:hypothetical protein
MTLRWARGIHWGAVYGLLVIAGCPQVKSDDFAVIEGSGGGAGDAGVAGGCGNGVAARGCDAGGVSTPDDPNAGDPSAGDAGNDAASGTDAVPACESDAVRGPDGDCYFADPTTSTWSEARASCLERGTGWDLAALQGAEENDFVVALTGYEAWIGGTDQADEGTWLWVRDGEPFFTVGAAPSAVFTPWSSDEPNDFEDSDCLRVLTTGLWADWDCDDGAYGHVCQRELP